MALVIIGDEDGFDAFTWDKCANKTDAGVSPVEVALRYASLQEFGTFG